MVERKSGISCLGVSYASLGGLGPPEEVFIKVICNFGAVLISDRPAIFEICKVSKKLEYNLRTTL